MPEGDFAGLVDVMGYILAVKERLTSTDGMFDPIKQTIELLKAYNHEMPEKVYAQLHNLPEKWNNTKKERAKIRIIFNLNSHTNKFSPMFWVLKIWNF